MGRRREVHDPDRFLQLRGDHFHYRRRVPKEVRHLDERGEFIRRALDTTIFPDSGAVKPLLGVV